MSTPPPDPRSPRAEGVGLPPDSQTAPLPNTGDDGSPTATTTPPAPVPSLGPSPFVDGQMPPQRPNIGSMLFLTAFFFFTSSNNTAPPMVIIGPDGQIQPRVTELDRARTQLDEYRGFLNGSSTAGNETNAWTEDSKPGVLPYDILPHSYRHPAGSGREFYRNITGFHRDGFAHPVDLTNGSSGDKFWGHTDLPSLNSSAVGGVWNETLAGEMKGSFDWTGVDKWEMNLKERDILPARSTSTDESGRGKNTTLSVVGLNDKEWAWVRGTITLHTHSRSPSLAELTRQMEVEYGFYGLHHLPNGTYELYGVPDGRYLDMRNIPRLYPNHHNTTRSIILRELEKELEVQEGNLLLTDVRPEDTSTVTRCPILIHFSLPPIPAGRDAADLKLYDQELRQPTGLLASLPSPPQYWHRQLNGVGGMGGVIVADQCGVVLGLEGGKGIKLDYFWKKSINYAFLATISQLLVLILLVRQMELTRTPSTLSKVSLWSIVLMGAADSWIFSAHVAVGTMSDNKTSLPLLVPGFLSLCTAIVFGPRYAVILYRIQAPERGSDPELPPPAQIRPAGVGASDAETAEAGGILASDSSDQSPITRLRQYLDERPRLKWCSIAAFAVILFQVVLVPSVLPVFMFTLYSFWIPQIWRNATRGTIGVDMIFVLGTSVGRLALPLYALGCPDNVFFIETSPWIWGLVWWQAIQIAMLFAQERFGPSFFLPKRFAPPEGYDYHPLLLPSPSSPSSPTSPKDLKSADGSIAQGTNMGIMGIDDKTCSICMEEVDIRPSTSLVTAASESLLTGKLGLGQRRTYALAPCGHLFHTGCLAQWLAVKTICPLCKRSLPPL